MEQKHLYWKSLRDGVRIRIVLYESKIGWAMLGRLKNKFGVRLSQFRRGNVRSECGFDETSRRCLVIGEVRSGQVRIKNSVDRAVDFYL